MSTPEELERAKGSLAGRTECKNQVFKDTSVLLEICKKDAEAAGLGESAAVALFNARAPLALTRKPKADKAPPAKPGK